MQDKVNLLQKLEELLVEAVKESDKEKELMLVKQIILNIENIQDLAKLRTILYNNFKADYRHEFYELPPQKTADLDRLINEEL